MPVLFQFFRATDLQHLTWLQLDELKHTVYEAIDDPEHPPAQEIVDRAHAVFRQLKQLKPDYPLQPVERKASDPILYQIFHRDDLESLTPHEYSILDMAVKHAAIFSYQSLDTIRELTRRKYEQFRTPQGKQPLPRPQGPDSKLSPDHPDNGGSYPRRP